MNFPIKSLTVGALFLTCAATVLAEDKKLDLDECIAIALSDNPTIKIADREVDRVDYSKKEIIGQLLPTIDFGATYNRMLAKQVMYMNMDGLGDFGGMGGGNNSGDNDEANTSRAG